MRWSLYIFHHSQTLDVVVWQSRPLYIFCSVIMEYLCIFLFFFLVRAFLPNMNKYYFIYCDILSVYCVDHKMVLHPHPNINVYQKYFRIMDDLRNLNSLKMECYLHVNLYNSAFSFYDIFFSKFKANLHFDLQWKVEHI